MSRLSIKAAAVGVGLTAGALLLVCSVDPPAADGSDCYGGYYPRSYYNYYPYYQTYYPPSLTFTSAPPDQGEVIKSLAGGLLQSVAARDAAKDEIIRVERERNAALQALLASGVPIPPELKDAMGMRARPSHPGLALVLDTCTKCHSARDKAAAGEGHVMWDGDVFVGSREQLEKARDRIENGSMPPRAKWDWDRKGPALSGLTRMKIGDGPMEAKKTPVKETPK